MKEVDWPEWVQRLYDVRGEHDKLMIMITNKHYEVTRDREQFKVLDRLELEQ